MNHAPTPAPRPDTRTRPWHGIMVATALPLREDLGVDYDAYAEHVAWLIAEGCDGVVPNGSLGEYQTLTDEERARVVRTAVEAAGDGARVMPGVAAYGSAEARRWAEQAAEAGAYPSCSCPPTPSAPTRRPSAPTTPTSPVQGCPWSRTTTPSTPRWT